jgi:uncharacterized protein
MLMAEKLFISPNELYRDAFILAKEIFDSGYKPNYLLALWRGGAPVGCVVQEYLSRMKVKTDHISPRTSFYEEDRIEVRKKEVVVHGLGYVVNRANAEDSVLIIDDVWETGQSQQAVRKILEERMRKNFPKEVRTAVIHYKPENDTTGSSPDYFRHKTSDWIVYPHEVVDLLIEDLVEGKQFLGDEEFIRDMFPEPPE